MKHKIFAATAAAALLAAIGVAGATAQDQTPGPLPEHARSGGGQGQGPGGRMRGMGGFGGGNSTLGTVTEVTADHYTIKTDTGDSYTVHYSVNTRILKQSGGGRRYSAQGAGPGSGSGPGTGAPDGERPEVQSLKPTDIKVGDIIAAGGEVDATSKSIGAIFIMQVDPERAKQMREMQASFGKTWLAGRITAIDGTRITINGMADHQPHAIEVDENTSFHRRRDSITLADIQPGEQLRAEGAIKGGVFIATTVNAMIPQNRDQNRDPNSGGPGSGGPPPGIPPPPQ